MDQVLEALGAEVLDWDFKTECCGSGLALSKTDKVVELSGRVIREAAYRGADAIVVVCQLCQANLDMRQTEISQASGKNYEIPVVYLTQLLGLALGPGPGAPGAHPPPDRPHAGPEKKARDRNDEKRLRRRLSR